MPFVPVPNTVLVEVRMALDGQQVENTLYFEMAAVPTPPDMTTLGNAVEAWWIAEYAPLVTTSVVLRETVVTDLTTNTGPQVTITAPPGANGQNLNPTLPNNVTLTVSFRTNLRGRSFRGRNYVIGIPETEVVASSVIEGYADSWQAAYQALPDAISATDYVWVVVSRFSGVDPVTGDPIPRVTGVTTPISSVIVVDNVVDSQRRRLPGRGN